MKKYHSFSALFLVIVLGLGLTLPAAAAQESFSVNATAAILIDADYDQVLYEYNADERRYPASITKVMTGLLTVEAAGRGELSLDDQVTLTDELYTGIGEDGSTQNLKSGEILTIRDLLYCALIPSANEACNALAIAVAGDIPSFVGLMNARAAELGMTGTHFANTHGYHDENHYTTARDVSRMCLAAMDNPDFREIVSSVSYTVPATNLNKARELHDTNALMTRYRTGRDDLLYKYAVGIKTGSTPEAGYCLASAARKNERLLIAVLLGGENWRSSDENYFSESKRMLEYGFNEFTRREILSDIEPVDTVPVELCAQQDYVTVQPARALEGTLHTSVDLSKFERTVDLPETLDAPIAKGQKLGTVTLTYDGQEYGTVDLVAATALERSQFLYVKRTALNFLSQLWVKLLLLVVVLLALFLVLRRMVFGPSRRKSRSSRGSRSYTASYRGRRR